MFRAINLFKARELTVFFSGGVPVVCKGMEIVGIQITPKAPFSRTRQRCPPDIRVAVSASIYEGNYMELGNRRSTAYEMSARNITLGPPH